MALGVGLCSSCSVGVASLIDVAGVIHELYRIVFKSNEFVFVGTNFKSDGGLCGEVDLVVGLCSLGLDSLHSQDVSDVVVYTSC